MLLHALPIFHVHGLFVALNMALMNGAPIIWLAGSISAAVITAAARSTVMMGVPTFYTRLLGDKSFGQAHCGNMRLFISGSAPLLAETHVEFEARTGHAILERYGMTEDRHDHVEPLSDGARLAGTVGYALPGVSVRIADDEGRGAAGRRGRRARGEGPERVQGLLAQPGEDRRGFHADGYFVTGDCR